MRTPKANVRRILPGAYCVKLDDGSGYIVWPGKVGSRGVERPAIGLGKNQLSAWLDAEKTTKSNT